jgi:hypothetical protein
MSRKTWLLALVAAAVGSAAARAGGPPVVYAKIDKVVIEPAGGPAERVQVWGTFALMKEGEGFHYTEPTQGYLYYKIAGKEAWCREEWEALKRAADKGEVVAFGHCHGPKDAGTVRQAKEKPQAPDAYPIGSVWVARPGEANEPPVKALLAAKRTETAKAHK